MPDDAAVAPERHYRFRMRPSRPIDHAPRRSGKIGLHQRAAGSVLRGRRIGTARHGRFGEPLACGVDVLLGDVAGDNRRQREHSQNQLTAGAAPWRIE